jgi:hypothetical protein
VRRQIDREFEIPPAGARFDVLGNQPSPAHAMERRGRTRSRSQTQILATGITGVNSRAEGKRYSLRIVDLGAGRQLGGLAVAVAVDRRARCCREVPTIRACPRRITKHCASCEESLGNKNRS